MNTKLKAKWSWQDAQWIPPLLLAMLLAVYIYFGMPHERVIQSVWVLLFKLVPFFLVSFSIAWFPMRFPNWLKLVAVFAVLLPFLGFLVPRELSLTIEGFSLVDSPNAANVSDSLETIFGEFYTVMAMLVPYVILGLAFAYRCGGGSASGSLKISWAGILLMLSGYEDIMFWAVNDRGPFPNVAQWASHVSIFLGRPATRTEFYIFVAVHFILIAIVFALPLERIGEWLGHVLWPVKASRQENALG